MNSNERLKFYLGEKLYNQEFNIQDYNLNKDINMLKNSTWFAKEIYEISLVKLLIKTNNQDKKFKFQPGDVILKQDLCTLVKNRYNNNNSVILRCLNFSRHWPAYYYVQKDILFDNKKNIIFWRGATTGYSGVNKPGNRFTLIEKWFDKSKYIDIAFSRICQNQDSYKKYVKSFVNIEQMLKYKYILSVEGNDKDSGLNWKLNSNSVVLMTKPRVTSWLMETTLIPNHHYVLLKDDFSDLEEKLEWCNNHQNECKKIVLNAKKFMSQFADKKKEEKLEENVINKYFELIGQ